MKKYKISKILSGNDGYLDLIAVDGRHVPVLVPESCQRMLSRGTRVMVYYNRANRPVACSFGPNLVMMERPLNDDSIAKFIGELRDVYHGHMDSLMFKYALRRSLCNMGIRPTWNVAVDIQMYNYMHNLNKTR